MRIDVLAVKDLPNICAAGGLSTPFFGELIVGHKIVSVEKKTIDYRGFEELALVVVLDNDTKLYFVDEESHCCFEPFIEIDVISSDTKPPPKPKQNIFDNCKEI